VRGEVVAREVNSQMANYSIDMKNCIVMSDYPKTNIMVFQRASVENVYTKMLMAKERKIKCIYEIDDDMLNMPESFKKPYEYYSQPKVRQTILDFMAKSDAITVSTEELAKTTAVICPKKPIYIVENFLDVENWNDAFTKRLARKDDGVVTIGWMASGSHLMDIPVVRDALEIILENFPQVRLHFIGWVGFDNLNLEKYKDRIIVEDWVSITAIPYAMMDFDINICPLLDCKFNASKSHLKYLQGAALGIPSVCSPLAPYNKVLSHMQDGMFATDTASWLDCFKELIENKELRNRLGMNARSKLLESYDIKHKYLNWVNVFERVMKE